MPVYNVERYLEECIDSLLAQTYPNIEIILVDDGSPDKCPEICDAFSANYSNIKVVHQKNAGLPFARNAGLAVATGDYISFVDSDDAILEDMYSILINKMEKDNSDMAVCNFRLFNKAGTANVSQRYKEGILSFKSDAIFYYDCALDACWNRVYKSNIIKDNSLLFEDKKIVAQEDFWFNFRYCCHASQISTTDKSFYLYRQRVSSITKSHFDNDITDRCCDFIGLAQDYIKTAGRNSDHFFERMTLNLLFSSINNLTLPKIRKIKNIVSKFKNTPYFEAAVSKSEPQSGGIRGYYDRFLRFTLKHRWYSVFALLECVRVKRLNSKKRSEVYFE